MPPDRETYGRRGLLGRFLSCTGVLAFPAGCLLFALIDPPRDAPTPEPWVRVAYFLGGLLLIGGGYLAVRKGQKLQFPEPPKERKKLEKRKKPEKRKKLGDADRSRIRRYTVWVAAVIGVGGAIFWLTSFFLGDAVPHDIRVKGVDELLDALVRHTALTAAAAWVCHRVLRNRVQD